MLLRVGITRFLLAMRRCCLDRENKVIVKGFDGKPLVGALALLCLVCGCRQQASKIPLTPALPIGSTVPSFELKAVRGGTYSPVGKLLLLSFMNTQADPTASTPDPSRFQVANQSLKLHVTASGLDDNQAFDLFDAELIELPKEEAEGLLPSQELAIYEHSQNVSVLPQATCLRVEAQGMTPSNEIYLTGEALVGVKRRTK